MTKRVIVTKDYEVPAHDPRYPPSKERIRLYEFPTRKNGGPYDLVRECFQKPNPTQPKGYWYDYVTLLSKVYFRDILIFIELGKTTEVGLAEAELLGKAIDRR